MKALFKIQVLKLSRAVHLSDSHSHSAWGIKNEPLLKFTEKQDYSDYSLWPSLLEVLQNNSLKEGEE